MNYMKGLLSLPVFFSLLFTLPTSLQAQVQTPHYYTSMGSNTNGFYEYLPAGYANSSRNYPLIIFFHGVGERGDGSPMYLPVLLTYGPASLINEGKFPPSFTVNGQTFSFIVLTPQFMQWPVPTDIDQVINYALQHYRVDVNRIYLTGTSMGGGAVWEYTGNNSSYAKKAAAIVPVAGASYPDQTRSNIIAASNLPVWAFHNDNDPIVPSSNTINYINNINSSPTPPNPLARKTIFHSYVHDAWTTAYDASYKENGLNIYEWMLQFSRSITPPNQPPIANAGADQTITLPVSSVTLNGSGSKDPDGIIASYSWNQLSGPSQASFSGNTIVSPAVNNLIAGIYKFRLTVADNKNATATDDVTITVNPAVITNPGTIHIEAESFTASYSMMTQPTSDAGGGLNAGGIGTGSWMDYTVNIPASGNYNFSARIATPNTGVQMQVKKADGTILNTITIPSTNGWQNWATVTSTLSLVSGSQTIRIYSLNGSWNFNWFELAFSNTSTVNLPPVVSAGNNQTIILPSNTVSLSGTASDPDGTIASIKWSQAGGPSSSIISTPDKLQTSVSGLIEGIYKFQLQATDNMGASATAIVQITVNTVTSPPSSLCGKAVKIVVLGSSTAYGTGATPIDSSWVNKYTSYIKTKNSQHTLVNLAEPGYTTYEVLRPTGSIPPSGRPSPDSAHNITKALSLKPDAIIINLPTNDIGYGYTLTEIENNYETAVSLANSAHVPVWFTTTQPRTNLNTGERNNLMLLRDWTYSRFGGHAIDFWTTVANPDGSINSAYSYGDNIHVNNAGHQIFYIRTKERSILDSLCQPAPSNPLPVVNAGPDQVITLPNNSVTLSGTATANGTIVSYLWSLVSGPSQYTFSNASSSTTTVTNLVQGIYKFQLKATDNLGGSNIAITQVTVNSSGPVTNGITRYIKVQIYGGANPYLDAQWNNWNAGTVAVNNLNSGALKYTDGTSSAISSVLSYSQSTGDNGSNYATTISGTMAPAGVLRYTSYADAPRTLTISGLSVSKNYDIELYASRYSSGNSSIFSVNGISDTIVTYDNYTDKSRFTNIVPNAQGQIIINETKTVTYSYLNGFMITEQGTDYKPGNIIQAGGRIITSAEDGSAFLDVYPNPVSKRFTLVIHNNYTGLFTVQIIGMDGIIKKQYHLVKNTLQGMHVELSVEDVPGGTYFVKLQTGNRIEVKKVIKN